jgi:hypothetical protein
MLELQGSNVVKGLIMVEVQNLETYERNWLYLLFEIS